MVETIYRRESRRVFATLIRLLGDFDLAEEALHDAFVAAMEQWPRDGVPGNPRAWLVSTGRFRAIDAIRKRARFDRSLEELARSLEHQSLNPEISESPLINPAFINPTLSNPAIDDDSLRLIFTCCHPALSPDARVALTLREMCGLTTEEIAHAFFVTPPTIAQRIVRAKSKIREAKIPYQVPAHEDLPARLDTVLHVVYLAFNEGYSASSGETVTRADLSGEAIRLARLIVELMPEPECLGLLALMLLHESRRAARTADDEEIVLLSDQDRSKWDRVAIGEGLALIDRAIAGGPAGPFTLQAAILGVHAQAADAESTNWDDIAGLYSLLLQIDPSPVIELNRAVAIAMRDGPAAGLALIDNILGRGDLSDYQFAHSARADLLRRLGRRGEAVTAYTRALALAGQAPEQRFLRRRLQSLASDPDDQHIAEGRQRP
jgi:RNA polymerase sigma-70 factor (ECF subfamily)